MTRKHYLLKDVARILRLKPYRIAYALSTGLVEEPGLRIANKRIFAPEDIDRLASHFGIILPPAKTGRKGCSARAAEAATEPEQAGLRRIRDGQ